MHLFKAKRVSNSSSSVASPSSPVPSSSGPSSSATSPQTDRPSSSASKRNAKPIKKAVSKKKRSLGRSPSVHSSTSSTSSWSCHGAPSSLPRESVLLGWNGQDNHQHAGQPSSYENGCAASGLDSHDLWRGVIDEQQEEWMRDGPPAQDGSQPDHTTRMAFSSSAESSLATRARTSSAPASDQLWEAGPSSQRQSDRASSSTIPSAFSPWSSASYRSSSTNSSTSQGYQVNATSSTSIPSSLATSSSSSWMSKGGLRIDTDQLPLASPSSPSAMSSVKTFIFPSFASSSSSSPSSSKPPSISRRPSYQIEFEDEDPFAAGPTQHLRHQRQTSATAPLHLARQPQPVRVTTAHPSGLASSPSSIHSSPDESMAHLALPLLPRPPRSSSRPKAANPSVTRITRERSSSNASTAESSHSSFFFPSQSTTASPQSISSVLPAPPTVKRSSNTHPPPTRPPPPIPTSSNHSHTPSAASSAASEELDGVWEGFLSEVVGKMALADTPASTRSSWQDKPLPAAPGGTSSNFSVALRPSESAASGLAYLDEDDDEAADEPFSLDASFTASEYYNPNSSIFTTSGSNLPNSASVQSIFEISAFNFPVPPSHVPHSTGTVPPPRRPSRHGSSLSTSSSLSSVSNGGSSMPVTPSFASPACAKAEGDLWGAGGKRDGQPWGQEHDREVVMDEERTIAWGGQRRMASEVSEEGEVVWGEAL